MHPIIATPRLALRQMDWDDLDFLAELLGDAEVTRFYPQTHDRDGSARWLQRQLDRYAQDGHGFWLVCDRQTGAPRGQVGVTTQEIAGRKIIEVGYLMHRPFWRQGLAGEAACACRDWAFRNLDIGAVHSLVRPVNIPSQGVARKNGMTPLPEPVLFHELEHLLFQITRAEWERIQSAPP